MSLRFFFHLIVLTKRTFKRNVIDVSRRFNSVNIYLFKVNNKNTRKGSEIFSKLTIKTPKRRH